MVVSRLKGLLPFVIGPIFGFDSDYEELETC